MELRLEDDGGVSSKEAGASRGDGAGEERKEVEYAGEGSGQVDGLAVDGTGEHVG